MLEVLTNPLGLTLHVAQMACGSLDKLQLCAGWRQCSNRLLNVGVFRTLCDDSPEALIGRGGASEVDAYFVVVGHHRRSAIDRLWHGSVDHTLLDRLPCSLFVSVSRSAANRSS